MIGKILLTAVLLFPLASGYELGVSPPQINYFGNLSELLCNNITIISRDYEGEIISMDKWSNKYHFSRNLNEYSLTDQDLGIYIEYPKSFILDKKTEINVCIKAEKEGSYYGAMLFQANNMSLGVGSWVNLIVEDENETNNAHNLILGQVLFMSIILAAFLLYMVFLTSKRRSNI